MVAILAGNEILRKSENVLFTHLFFQSYTSPYDVANQRAIGLVSW